MMGETNLKIAAIHQPPVEVLGCVLTRSIYTEKAGMDGVVLAVVELYQLVCASITLCYSTLLQCQAVTPCMPDGHFLIFIPSVYHSSALARLSVCHSSALARLSVCHSSAQFEMLAFYFTLYSAADKLCVMWLSFFIVNFL